MPFINIMQDILIAENVYNRERTFYQKFNVGNDFRVYRFANLSDHTNNKVLVNLPAFYLSKE